MQKGAPRENFSTVTSYAGACNGHPKGAPPTYLDILPSEWKGAGAPRENFSTVASYAGACNGHPTGAPIGEHLNMHPLKTKAGEAPLEKINYRISYACSRHG